MGKPSSLRGRDNGTFYTHCHADARVGTRVYARPRNQWYLGDEIRREMAFALSVNPCRADRGGASGECNKVDNNTAPRIFSASCKSRGKSTPSPQTRGPPSEYIYAPAKPARAHVDTCRGWFAAGRRVKNARFARELFRNEKFPRVGRIHARGSVRRNNLPIYSREWKRKTSSRDRATSIVRSRPRRGRGRWRRTMEGFSCN